MSVLIKDMEKPKSCYAVIDGESKYCPFVNTDDDCVLQLKKGICEGTWADQYSKCPLIETPEPCEDAVSREDLIERLNGINGTAELDAVFEIVENMPSAQPDGIPLEWIDKHLEWLDNCDNDFAQLSKVSIRAMVELWKKDRI